MDENNNLLSQKLMTNNLKRLFKKKKEVKYINVPFLDSNILVQCESGNLGGSVFACGFPKNQNTEFDEKEKDKSAKAKWKEIPDGSCTLYPIPSPLYSEQLVKIEKENVCSLVPLFCYTFNMCNYQSPMLIFNIDNPPPVEISRIAYGKTSSTCTRAPGADSRLRSAKQSAKHGKKSATDVKSNKVKGDFPSLSETSSLNVVKHENFDGFLLRSDISQIWSDQSNPMRNIELFKSVPAQNLKLVDANCSICNSPWHSSFAATSAENATHKASGSELKLLSEEPRSLFHNLYRSRKDTEIQKINFEMVHEEKQVEMPYNTEHEFSSATKAVYKSENSYIKQDDAVKFVDDIVKMRTDVESIFGSELQFPTTNIDLEKTVFDSTSNFLTDIRIPNRKEEYKRKRHWKNPHYDGRHIDYDKVFPIFLRRTMFSLWNRLPDFQEKSEVTSYYTLFGSSSGIELSKIV